MNITQIEEALTISDTSLRCQRVLDEVQPVLRQLMDDFKNKYGNEVPELLDYKVHTYEATLRTTMHDARNPKYAESKANTDIGKKAFVSILDKSYFGMEIGMLSLEMNGMDKTLKIIMNSSFYPFWNGIRTKGNIKQFTDMLGSLSDRLTIHEIDKVNFTIPRHEFIGYIQKCEKENRTPWFSFGIYFPFNEMPLDEELLRMIWETWHDLEALRKYIKDEAAEHSNSLKLFDLLNKHKEDFQIELYGKTYVVKLEETALRGNCRQLYNITDKGQLLTKAAFHHFERLPHEVLGVKTDGRGDIYASLRAIHGKGKVEWTISKSYYSRGKENSSETNRLNQSRAMEALAEHGFKVQDNSFYIGTWDNETGHFTESIEEIKKRLFVSALILADSKRKINLPKDDHPVASSLEEEGSEDEVEVEAFEDYKHDFNLANILSNVSESPFTYSNAIIRDFHLNLTSLEDKHFVILNGISGTGKTRLCLLYANAVYGRTYDDLNPNLKVIPVRPDWTDSTSLFGYYSALEKRYVRTPFLNAILQAIQEGKPMFIVLDEMNLARVEYYLSDYLSAIESRQPIRLHTESHITDVPQELQIPHNLYVIGTINVDETTHGISDKVLDRAFVMTLSDVDLEQFWEAAESKYKANLQDEWKLLRELHLKLSRFDLHFGYRTINEMLRKLYANAELDPDIRMEKKEAVDRVIAEKVMPKIRGDERIDALLIDLIDWTSALFGDGSESLYHLLRMKGELDRYGATQFWR
ncbi:McrB family protein [Paenibacillus sp. GCM10023248]|uniref:McrB family protein n=1 Tax=unclassified Paenibacillus TaxID=185978 RepID=UPI002378C06D|nr:AAA family ATPase [Paenibacillus sp. MAHUQ-63]MDD9271477.1 AAA family ATPase [Paenibacillus sp. MAHUQ-63]